MAGGTPAVIAPHVPLVPLGTASPPVLGRASAGLPEDGWRRTPSGGAEGLGLLRQSQSHSNPKDCRVQPRCLGTRNDDAVHQTSQCTMLREGTFAFISVRLTQMGTEVPVCVRIKKEGWWPSSSTSPGSFIAPLMRKEQALLYPSSKPKILSLCY